VGAMNASRLDHVADDSVYVSALINGGERYIVLSDDSTKAEALRVIGRWASNPELSFSWCDAAQLAMRIMEGA
jgi:hypothetical protein